MATIDLKTCGWNLERKGYDIKHLFWKTFAIMVNHTSIYIKQKFINGLVFKSVGTCLVVWWKLPNSPITNCLGFEYGIHKVFFKNVCYVID